MPQPILLLDNNCLNRLASTNVRSRLAANLKATGREFWPTSVNVLEAIQTTDPERRARLLRTLSDLSGDRFALTLPGEALRRIAIAVKDGGAIDWSESEPTRMFRYPESVTAEEIALAREHLEAEERSFNQVHAEASVRMRPVLKTLGAKDLWKSPSAFVEQFWTNKENLAPYIEGIWKSWGFAPPAPIESLLNYDSWRLFFDGWGASVYARQVAHPQRGKVQMADLSQLVYLGGHQNRILATEDVEFRNLGSEIVKGRYGNAEVVSLDSLV